MIADRGWAWIWFMPPGGLGTTTVMALLGKVCACAASDTDAQAAAISSRFIGAPPVDWQAAVRPAPYWEMLAKTLIPNTREVNYRM